MGSFLVKIEYQLTVYVVSFVLIGTYWTIQNVMFQYFRQCSRVLIWLNLQFLFFLTLLPIVTQRIGTYWYEPKVMDVYGVVNIACSLSLAIVWWYANHAGPIVWLRIEPAIANRMTLCILLGAFLSLVAIGPLLSTSVFPMSYEILGLKRYKEQQAQQQGVVHGFRASRWFPCLQMGNGLQVRRDSSTSLTRQV